MISSTYLNLVYCLFRNTLFWIQGDKAARRSSWNCYRRPPLSWAVLSAIKRRSGHCRALLMWNGENKVINISLLTWIRNYMITCTSFQVVSPCLTVNIVNHQQEILSMSTNLREIQSVTASCRSEFLSLDRRMESALNRLQEAGRCRQNRSKQKLSSVLFLGLGIPKFSWFRVTEALKLAW